LDNGPINKKQGGPQSNLAEYPTCFHRGKLLCRELISGSSEK